MHAASSVREPGYCWAAEQQRAVEIEKAAGQSSRKKCSRSQGRFGRAAGGSRGGGACGSDRPPSTHLHPASSACIRSEK